MLNSTLTQGLGAALLVAGFVGIENARSPAVEADEQPERGSLKRATSELPVEQQAVAAIEKLGGRVTRDPKADGKPAIGVDLSRNSANNDPVTDTDLKAVGALRQLRELSL